MVSPIAMLHALDVSGGDGCPSAPVVVPRTDTCFEMRNVLEYCLSIVHNVHMLHTMQRLLAVFQITS